MDGDQYAGTIFALTDISEYRRVEDALRKSEGKFKAIFDGADVGITAINPDGKLLDFNDKLIAILGFPRDELEKMSFVEYTHPEDVKQSWEMFNEIKAGKITHYELDKRYIRKGGEIVWARISVSMVEPGKGEAPIVLSIINDITELKLAEEELRKAHNKISLLSSITRHDINNQLTILMGNVMLLKTKTSDADILSRLEKVESSSRRIIDQIKFTKDYQELGKASPQWQSVAGVITALPESKEIANLRISDELGKLEIFVDPMLGKVLHNLLEDSARYGGKPTTVAFDCRPDDNGIVILYEDVGPGVPMGEKEKIFEKGYGKGTGLGLFLSREILSITGIALKETGEPGKGIRFEIHVPPGQFRFSPDLVDKAAPEQNRLMGQV